MMDDFNETMWQPEHFLETRQGGLQMEHFMDVLADCDRRLGMIGLLWLTMDLRI